MTSDEDCKQRAEQLLAYMAGDEDVWDGYGVYEVASILEPLAHFYLENACLPSARSP